MFATQNFITHVEPGADIGELVERYEREFIAALGDLTKGHEVISSHFPLDYDRVLTVLTLKPLPKATLVGKSDIHLSYTDRSQVDRLN